MSAANVVLSKEIVRKEWEAVVEAEQRARSLREQFTHLAGYLRLVGNEDWIPEVQPTKPLTVLDALSAVVAQHPNGIRPRDIVKALGAKGVSAASVYNNLSKAAMKNRIRREGKLYYPHSSY